MKYATIILVLMVLLAACGSRRAGSAGGSTDGAAPENWGFRVVETYPHDPTAYTQGLLWHEGRLWESTGEYGRSTMREVILESGEVVRKVALADKFFGEGAAILGDKIYQLTWQQGVCFVWDTATLSPTGQFTYDGEGWGLTTDGERLYMSDGTPNISVVDPATFAVTSTIVVRREGSPVHYINELEWIDGRIWANVYLTNEVIVIDPADGQVVASIDLGSLVSRLTITPTTDVMNGIAFDPLARRIFVTGKNWNKLFELEVAR